MFEDLVGSKAGEADWGGITASLLGLSEDLKFYLQSREKPVQPLFLPSALTRG